jgi:hypothetical protein
LSFAQASASFDTAQYPARSYIRSGVYFGIGENVTSAGVIENSFVAEELASVRARVDVGWNGDLSTKGWGSMSSRFEVMLRILGPDGSIIVEPVVSGRVAIDSSTAHMPVSGNGSLAIDFLVSQGETYTIQLIAVCRSSGSSNIWASDTECAFDREVGGYVEWRSLEIELTPAIVPAG